MNDLHRRLVGRSLALGLTLCAVLELAGCSSKAKGIEATAERGTVQRLVGQGPGAALEICDPKAAACSTAQVGSAVPAGSVLRSGARASAQVNFADGTELELDHDTELCLAAN